MTIGTVLSRVTGLIRLAAIAAALGVAESRLADVYNIANTAPNIIYELVLGGVLTSVFVPVFVELMEKEGRERAWEVASAIINLCLVALMAVAALGILAAPLIAKFYGARLQGGDELRQIEILTFLLRLFIPQIIFYGLAALTAGLLNAHKRFGPPMYTSILNNLAVIAVFVAFQQAYGGITDLDQVTTSQQLVIGLGTTAGVVLMALTQASFLRGIASYRFVFSPRHPSVKKLARLAVFVVGYVVTNQIGYLIVQWLAYGEQGGYSAYVNAFTFFMLPHGLFAVSIITALLPGMSELAINQRWDAFRERLSTGIRATIFLVLPAAVGYLVLGEPIVRLLLQRGVMTDTSVELVAAVLRFFVIGLVFFSVFQLFLRAFYAIQDTKTPFLINLGAVAINLAVNVPLFAVLDTPGLAAGHALAYVFGVVMQAWALSRRIGGLGGRAIMVSAARVAGAAALMAAVVWPLSRFLEDRWGDSGGGQLLAVLVPVAVGAATYLGGAMAFRVEELRFVRNLISRR